MKKTLFMAGLVLMSTACFAQSANVKRAKSLALSEEPKFDEARALIHEAETNPETMDQTNTWFVAGLIGSAQLDKLNMDQMLGQQVDENLRGEVANEAYDSYMKADELASKQMIDKKGNPMVDKKTGEPVVDTKTRKSIATKLLAIYQGQDFIKYGVYKNDQREFAEAYEAFNKHLSIPMLSCFDEKTRAKMPLDSTYYQYKYYAALFALQAENHYAAIELLKDLKDRDNDAMLCAQFLYQEYMNVGDTVSALASLNESIERYQSEPWFLQNLVNYYVGIKDTTAVFESINRAIAQDPTQAQYFHLRANFLDDMGKSDEAYADYAHALELDPNMADAVAGQGRTFYNRAVKVNEEAAYLDGKAYKAALDKMNSLFKESLPYFEKAHQMDPENRTYMSILKTLYYRFEMDKEYEEMNKKLEY